MLNTPWRHSNNKINSYTQFSRFYLSHTLGENIKSIWYKSYPYINNKSKADNYLCSILNKNNQNFNSDLECHDGNITPGDMLGPKQPREQSRDVNMGSYPWVGYKLGWVICGLGWAGLFYPTLTSLEQSIITVTKHQAIYESITEPNKENREANRGVEPRRPHI
ncbi:hypothetical protein YC2023_028081 [Brassica napus]